MTERAETKVRRQDSATRIRAMAVYGVYFGLATIELVLAASPGGRAYNAVGAVLALVLMVLSRA